MGKKKQVLLLVEDDDDDAFFMRHALKEARVRYAVQVVSDGEQAMDYLLGNEKYADRKKFPAPTVVLLDLKLPLLSGFELLAWMHERPDLSELPVVVLTGSAEERDKARARELGAKGYYVKPPNVRIVHEMLASVGLGSEV